MLPQRPRVTSHDLPALLYKEQPRSVQPLDLDERVAVVPGSPEGNWVRRVVDEHNARISLTRQLILHMSIPHAVCGGGLCG